ncbi:hypothetical protein E6C67_14085 [Azospirillum sp. TSA2s]|nr:hypothetical protein E6C67_14085 [Azospirillum sp. TSA2s]
MISPLSINWTMLNTLRALPGPEALRPTASLMEITQAVRLKPVVVRPMLTDLVREGLAREYTTHCGLQYARTNEGDQKIQMIRDWLR